ncbi:basic proline-rich protein-like [Vulpes lagopus]|uniref:basic proline-rich protein-like n=1 Tax=Vulpes lagopus TaxID=494514 RepID=UPI001BC9E812|nr:basic proline-rich protein-like [Vulpes lagopus]
MTPRKPRPGPPGTRQPQRPRASHSCSSRPARCAPRRPRPPRPPATAASCGPCNSRTSASGCGRGSPRPRDPAPAGPGDRDFACLVKVAQPKMRASLVVQVALDSQNLGPGARRRHKRPYLVRQVMPRVRGRGGYRGDAAPAGRLRPLPGAPPSAAAAARRSSTFPARRTAPPSHPLQADTSGPAPPGPGRVPLAIPGSHVPCRRPQREARMRDPPDGGGGGGEPGGRAEPGVGGGADPLARALSTFPALCLPPSGAGLRLRGKCTRKLVPPYSQPSEGAGAQGPGRRGAGAQGRSRRKPGGPAALAPLPRRGGHIPRAPQAGTLHGLTCSRAQPPPPSRAPSRQRAPPGALGSQRSRGTARARVLGRRFRQKQKQTSPSANLERARAAESAGRRTSPSAAATPREGGTAGRAAQRLREPEAPPRPAPAAARSLLRARRLHNFARERPGPRLLLRRRGPAPLLESRAGGRRGRPRETRSRAGGRPAALSGAGGPAAAGPATLLRGQRPLSAPGTWRPGSPDRAPSPPAAARRALGRRGWGGCAPRSGSPGRQGRGAQPPAPGASRTAQPRSPRGPAWPPPEVNLRAPPPRPAAVC